MIAAIVAFIVVCVVLVLCLVLSYRRKKKIEEERGGENEGMEEDDYAKTNTMGVNANGSVVSSPGFAVCDERDLPKENHETNR